MCILIYAVVPANADLAKFPRTGPFVTPSAEKALAPRLRAGEQLCEVNGIPGCGGGGFCGTALGRDRVHGTRTREETQLLKLRKRGWSEHKIQTWLAQKQAAATVKIAQRGSMAPAEELALWSKLIDAALDQARLDYFGLLKFWWSSLPYVPKRAGEVARDQIDLSRLEEDVLYRFHR